MKKPIQVEWLENQMKLTKENLKYWKKQAKESRNQVGAGEASRMISSLEYDLKMQKVIKSQITNYKALK